MPATRRTCFDRTRPSPRVVVGAASRINAVSTGALMAMICFCPRATRSTQHTARQSAERHAADGLDCACHTPHTSPATANVPTRAGPSARSEPRRRPRRDRDAQRRQRCHRPRRKAPDGDRSRRSSRSTTRRRNTRHTDWISCRRAAETPLQLRFGQQVQRVGRFAEEHYATQPQQVKGRLERPLGTPGSLGQGPHLAKLPRQQRHHALVSLKSITRSTMRRGFFTRHS